MPFSIKMNNSTNIDASCNEPIAPFDKDGTSRCNDILNSGSASADIFCASGYVSHVNLCMKEVNNTAINTKEDLFDLHSIFYSKVLHNVSDSMNNSSKAVEIITLEDDIEDKAGYHTDVAHCTENLISSNIDATEFTNESTMVGLLFKDDSDSVNSSSKAVELITLGDDIEEKAEYHIGVACCPSGNSISSNIDSSEFNNKLVEECDSSSSKSLFNGAHHSGNTSNLTLETNKFEDLEKNIKVRDAKINLQAEDIQKNIEADNIEENLQAEDIQKNLEAEEIQKNIETNFCKVPPFDMQHKNANRSSYINPNHYSFAKKIDHLEPFMKYIKDNKCVLCGFVSQSVDQYSIRSHMVIHLNRKDFKCDICHKNLASKSRLRHHKKIHDNSRSRIYSCRYCDETFLNYYRLKKHQNIHVTPEKHICAICEKELSNAWSLKEHYRIHTGEKPHCCYICNKSFSMRAKLRSHILSHNTKKLFNCQICDKSYNVKLLLKEHMNLHKKRSNIKCDICKKTFNFTANLKQHMLVHTDSRKHKCETCGLKFKLPHHLKSHLDSQH